MGYRVNRLTAALAVLAVFLLIGAGALQAQQRDDPEEYYYSAGWGDLTEVEQEIMGRLGWDEQRWDGGRITAYPESEFTVWSGRLGYDEQSWDAATPAP